MPPLGSGPVDAEVIALLEQWILGLDPNAEPDSTELSTSTAPMCWA